ncbi:IQ calmodulin-binding motif-containing protein 1-like [Liolophura sinensis]|uniref:IQ calmodulin-binding motif-containing protein 1-like n=1 Tax=Liolophura sinensis TaxID=3198878 RepID=UPI0031590570
MTDTRSPDKRDKRIVALAAGVTEAQDRKIPQVLLGLEEILVSVEGTNEAVKIKEDVWKLDLLPVLLLVLKKDYSLTPGGWRTASRLASTLSRVCCGLHPHTSEEYYNRQLPTAIDNMYIIARRVQARFSQIPHNMAIAHGKSELLSDFRSVLDSMLLLYTAHHHLRNHVIQSPWLLQLLISDDIETVVIVMNFLTGLVRTNSDVLRDLPEKFRQNIIDELIYKLSVNRDPTIGGAAMKCVLRLCNFYKPLVEFLCVRYRGLRPLLTKWTGKGFGLELKELLMLLESGSSERAEMERFHRAATTIQALWKGVLTRRKLKKADRSFAKFQRSFRQKLETTERRKEEEKMEKELEEQLLANRRKIMRDFHEKRLHLIEILPPQMLQGYMEKENTQAAIRIQKTWRGHRERLRREDRRDLATRSRAAVLIQRTVRRWLERLDKRRRDTSRFQKPPGLTDERRVQLQQVILERRESNPPKPRTREEQESLHRTAQELMARYYIGCKLTRGKHQQREALLARLETDSELLMYAPPLKDLTDKDVDMFSSRSVPVAARAQQAHKEELRLLRQPWWRKLGDEYQDQLYEEEQDLLF